MKRFFWSLFIALWLGAALTALVQAIFILGLAPRSISGPRYLDISDGVMSAEGQLAAQYLDGRGDGACRKYLETLGRSNHLEYGLIADGRLIGDLKPGWTTAYKNALTNQVRGISATLSGPVTFAEYVGGPNRTVFVVQAPPLAKGLVFFRLILVIIVPAIVCLLVARRYALPVERLRVVARKLAEGDLSARATPHGRPKGELQDLTNDFDLMAARLEEQASDQNRFLADVSHEIRSPLTRIKLVAELLRKGGKDREDLLGRIDHDCERLGWMVSQLSSLARLDHVATIDSREFDLATLAGQVIDQYSLEAETRGVDMLWDGESDLNVLAEPGSVYTALENLVRNALRFAPPGSDVAVAGGRQGSFVYVEVLDRGPGVEPAQLAKLTLPFFRGAKLDPSTEGGLGLGLAIASRCATANGGSLELANRECQGFRARLILPARPR